jgi:hypothetical protein
VISIEKAEISIENGAKASEKIIPLIALAVVAIAYGLIQINPGTR